MSDTYLVKLLPFNHEEKDVLKACNLPSDGHFQMGPYAGSVSQVIEQMEIEILNSPEKLRAAAMALFCFTLGRERGDSVETEIVTEYKRRGGN